MSVQVQCEHCGAQFKLKDESKVGKRMKCPKCQSVFVVSPMEDDLLDDFGEPALPMKPSGKSKGKGKKKGSKKKSSDGMPVLPMAIGGGVLLLAVIGVVIFLLLPSGEPAAPAAPVAAADEMPEAEAEPAEEAAPVTEGVIKTAWLPAETELVIQLRPAQLLQSRLLLPFMTSDLSVPLMAEFLNQTGLNPVAIESLTLGIVTPQDAMTGGMGGFSPGGMPGEGAAASDVVAVIRLTQDVAAGKLPFLGPASPAAGGGPAIHSLKNAPFGGFNPVHSTGPAGFDDPAMTAVSETETAAAESATEGGAGSTFSPDDVGVALPNTKMLVIGKRNVLAKLNGTPNAALVNRFGFVKQNSSLIVAMSLEGIEARRARITETINGSGPISPQARQNLTELLAMYDKGARGGLLSIDITDGARIQVGLSAKDEESVTALNEPVQEWINQLRNSAADLPAFFPDLLKSSLTDALNQLQPQQQGTVVGFTLALNADVMAELQMLVQQMAGGMMMAGLGQPAMLGGLGAGGTFPGIPGIPEMPVVPEHRIVSGTPQPSTMAEGLPEGLELSAIAAWVAPQSATPSVSIEFKPTPSSIDPNMIPEFDAGGAEGAKPIANLANQTALPTGNVLPTSGADGPVIAVDLVMDGEQAQKIVQFKQVLLKNAAAGAGQPLKQRRAVPAPHANADTWTETELIQVEEAGGTRWAIPLQFDPPADDVHVIGELSAEVVLRIADQVGEKDIPLEQLAQLQQPEDDGTIRIVPLLHAAEKAVYIGPSNRDVVILEVSAPNGVTSPPVMPGGSGVPPEVLAALAAQAEGGGAEMTIPAEGTSLPSGDAATGSPFGGLPRNVGGQFVITRPPLLSPQGFIVVLGKTGGIRVRTALGVREQPVSFGFENLSLPERDPSLGEPVIPWTEIASKDGLPPGIDTMFARGEWVPAAEDNRRRTLNVLIDVVGPAAARASAVGIYRLENCTADDKKLLTLDERNPGFKDLPRGFDRPDPWQRGTETPPDAFRLNFPLNAVDPQFTALVRLSGEVRMRIPQEQPELIVENLKQFVGKRVLHETLNAERVLMNLSQDEEAGTVTVTVPKDKLAALEIVDRNGLLDPNLTKSVTMEKNDELHTFSVREQRMDHLGLRIVLHKGVQVVRVPFTFENIPVPPAIVPEE